MNNAVYVGLMLKLPGEEMRQVGRYACNEESADFSSSIKPVQIIAHRFRDDGRPSRPVTKPVHFELIETTIPRLDLERAGPLLDRMIVKTVEKVGKIKGVMPYVSNSIISTGDMEVRAYLPYVLLKGFDELELLTYQPFFIAGIH